MIRRNNWNKDCDSEDEMSNSKEIRKYDLSVLLHVKISIFFSRFFLFFFLFIFAKSFKVEVVVLLKG